MSSRAIKVSVTNRGLNPRRHDGALRLSSRYVTDACTFPHGLSRSDGTSRYFTIKVCHVYQVLSRPTTVSRDRRVRGVKKLYVFPTFYGKNINKFCNCIPHRIGGNRERRVVNNFSFSIAKINVYDCQNRYNGNRKRLICVRRLPFWQSKMLYLAIVNDFSENERSFAIAAYPV